MNAPSAVAVHSSVLPGYQAALCHLTRQTCSKKDEDIVLFNLEITIDLKQIETKDLNTAVEVITSLIGPSLGRGRASFHINVEPAQHVPAA
jgi:hypothetical protein